MSARRAVTRAALVTGAAALIALGVMAARVWPGGSGAGDGGPIRIASADLDRGARLYDAHCAACHGAGLEGEADWRTPRADGTMPAPPHDGTAKPGTTETGCSFATPSSAGGRSSRSAGWRMSRAPCRASPTG